VGSSPTGPTDSLHRARVAGDIVRGRVLGHRGSTRSIRGIPRCRPDGRWGRWRHGR